MSGRGIPSGEIQISRAILRLVENGNKIDHLAMKKGEPPQKLACFLFFQH